MIEILVLIRFCRKLAAMARSKGRTGSWAALGAILWVGGEIGGAMIGFSSGARDLAPYGYALAGAALGAVVAYLIVSGLADANARDRLPQARVIS